MTYGDNKPNMQNRLYRRLDVIGVRVVVRVSLMSSPYVWRYFCDADNVTRVMAM